MKKLRPSTQYKKDLKRIRNNPKKAEAFLLIWIDQTTNDIDLVRLGSHSELFGKGVKR